MFYSFNLNKIYFSGELIMSLIIMTVISFFCFIVFILAKKTDPLKKPHGIISVFEIIIIKINDHLKQNNVNIAKLDVINSFLLTSVIYLCFSFFVGLIGFTNPLTYSYIPLSMSFCTFIIVHFISIKKNKINYLKNFFKPFFFFLPINILSELSPIISVTLRLFGSAFAGWILSSLFYEMILYFWEKITIITPFCMIVAPFFHIYFDIIAGAIQIFIFFSLSSLFILNSAN
ncbi:MAG: F0F1 ATP synthase subunit A [Bacilli bacterium]|nr:F0F1 ATP synthase subunit A [Bacilli bacterium]